MKSAVGLLLLALSGALLIVLIQIEVVGVAFEKLGLSPGAAGLWMAASLFGSAINIPVTTLASEPPPRDVLPAPLERLLHLPPLRHPGRTVLAVNVGGGVIPVLSAVFLLHHAALHPGVVVTAVGLVGLICRLASRPLPGVGIGIPLFIPPLAAASCALLLDPANSAPLAYVCGTMGVLLGADLARLGEIRRMGAPVASIGGAGTFDGIFLTGLVAVLLA
jgi:uncharacterized membrane protein